MTPLAPISPTIKGVLAHHSLWGKFDMLHSPVIGITELISTCYSVQLVRLPLHPQSSPPSPSSMYDNKHCSSGFPHPLIHISFIPYSYFCVCVRERENTHGSCTAADSAVSSVGIYAGFWKDTVKNEIFISNWCVWFCCCFCVAIIGWSFTYMCECVCPCTVRVDPIVPSVLWEEKKKTVFHTAESLTPKHQRQRVR